MIESRFGDTLLTTFQSYGDTTGCSQAYPWIYSVKIRKVSSRVAERTDADSCRISAALSSAICPFLRYKLFSNPTRQWPPAATAAIITSYSMYPKAQIDQLAISGKPSSSRGTSSDGSDWKSTE